MLLSKISSLQVKVKWQTFLVRRWISEIRPSMGHFRSRCLLPLQDLAPFQKGQSDFWRGRGTTAKIRESSAK